MLVELNSDFRSFPILLLSGSKYAPVPNPLLIEDMDGIVLYPEPGSKILTFDIAPWAVFDVVS